MVPVIREHVHRVQWRSCKEPKEDAQTMGGASRRAKRIGKTCGVCYTLGEGDDGKE